MRFNKTIDTGYKSLYARVNITQTGFDLANIFLCSNYRNQPVNFPVNFFKVLY